MLDTPPIQPGHRLYAACLVLTQVYTCSCLSRCQDYRNSNGPCATHSIRDAPLPAASPGTPLRLSSASPASQLNIYARRPTSRLPAPAAPSADNAVCQARRARTEALDGLRWRVLSMCFAAGRAATRQVARRRSEIHLSDVQSARNRHAQLIAYRPGYFPTFIRESERLSWIRRGPDRAN
ncbi:hypothetical protein FA95DRAFT_1200944 [Auriscalpium vulgare]|uniref:Uncharacterized protein n=1 Tax=Auriscalpium vulgare TaxID=40419 RepID=A0ACB8R395_9AGAM|nr:hypothetical protein FA95DRAFT_1200944 [Auriscalpium vulgare]